MDTSQILIYTHLKIYRNFRTEQDKPLFCPDESTDAGRGKVTHTVSGGFKSLKRL